MNGRGGSEFSLDSLVPSKRCKEIICKREGFVSYSSVLDVFLHPAESTEEVGAKEFCCEKLCRDLLVSAPFDTPFELVDTVF